MKRSTKYVGLDVHQATTVAAVREGRGRVIARSVIPTEAGPLVEFFQGMRGSVHVTFEEGTQAQWLHDLLVPVVDQVLVCDRRGETKRGNKGDQLDCDELSALLRRGALRAVYHGSPHRAALKELARTYLNLVGDSARTMQRIKALFRARAIRAGGRGVYGSRERSDWLAKLPDRAVRFRAEALYAQLDLHKSLRQEAKAAMIAEGRKDPAWRVLQTIPHVGPVRATLILAIMQTPWRFRTKRQLWAYAGLAVVTHSSSDFEIVNGQPVRRRRRPLTRGLNRNHNRDLKNVFKGMAAGATGKRGVLQDFYQGMLARGMREELARVTLARKLAAITLRLWKNGECFDPNELRVQAR
jgi:transposase